MDIIERIVSNGHGPADPRFLVIHDTDDPGADANRLWAWWDSENGRIQGYQVHYVVDWNGTLIHAVPDDRKAWHCGNGNSRSIGLEICVPKDASLYPQVWQYAVEAAKTILNKHGWSTDRMVSHKYAADTWGGSDHQDPIAFFAKMGHTWGDFVAAVNGQEVGPTSTVVEQQPAAQEHTGTGFGGTYTCQVDNLNVRTSPSTSAGVVAQYHRGETVTLQDWYVIADGYVWGRYVGGSGNTRYVAVGKPTGGPAADDYLTKGGSGSGRSAGTYRCTGDGVRVRRAPSLSGEVVAKYNRGETVRLDSFVDGDGLTWGSYVGASGHRNYVAAKYFERV